MKKRRSPPTRMELLLLGILFAILFHAWVVFQNPYIRIFQVKMPDVQQPSNLWR